MKYIKYLLLSLLILKVHSEDCSNFNGEYSLIINKKLINFYAIKYIKYIQ